MKTVLLIGIVVFLLTLDWAALHDILKGEPNLYAEYGMLLFSTIIFGVMIIIGVKMQEERSEDLLTGDL